MNRKGLIVFAFMVGVANTTIEAQELILEEKNIATEEVSSPQSEEETMTSDTKKSSIGLYAGGAFSYLTGYKEEVAGWEDYNSQMRKGVAFHLAIVAKPTRKLEVGGLFKFGKRTVQCDVHTYYYDEEEITEKKEDIITYYAGLCALYKENFRSSVGYLIAEISLGATYYTNVWTSGTSKGNGQCITIESIYSAGYLFNLTRNGRVACGPQVMVQLDTPFSVINGDFSFLPILDPRFDFGLTFNFNF